VRPRLELSSPRRRAGTRTAAQRIHGAAGKGGWHRVVQAGHGWRCGARRSVVAEYLGHPSAGPSIGVAPYPRELSLVRASPCRLAGRRGHRRKMREVRADLSLSWACFGNLSHWEVEANGGKIVGLSQWRTRNGVLLSSAVLVDPSPWTLLCDVMGMWDGYAMILSRRTTSCAQLLHKPQSIAELASSLFRALESALRNSARWPQPTAPDLAHG